METSALASIIAVPPTPFQEDGSLDLPSFVRMLERIAQGGVGTITIGGNTGEFAALAPGEVVALTESGHGAVPPATRLLTGVGGDLETARRVARDAESVGVFGVMVHEPVGPFRTAEGWLRYHVAIATSVPGIAVVPYVRDPRVAAPEVARLAELCPNVVAVKYAIPDPVRFAAMVADTPKRLVWVCGLAELWAPSFWPAGATGFTSGIASVAPALSRTLLDCLRAGDAEGARSAWAAVRPFEELRARTSGALNVAAIKEALTQLGVIGRTVRPPLSELDEAERVEVAAILGTWSSQMRSVAA
jgi:4-hydroxy-tetrahydrodipicolinate synthase